jgi:phosphohistidine phosphatase SixA
MARRRWGGLLGLALALAAPLALAQPAAAPEAPSSAPDAARAIALPALGHALRQGGYVIYFRHAATDMSRNDSGMAGLADCANQRPLNEQGRADARAIGRQLRALKLPPGEVLASPFCRTLETARLIFGKAQASDDVRERGERGDYPALRRLLSAPAAAGRNRWVVGHGIPFRNLAGPPHLQEGEAAVLKPEGDRWTVVARVPVEGWAQLR